MSSNTFTKILVPIDSSKNADKALSKAIVIGKKFDSELILIHVISDFIVDFSITDEGFQIPDTEVIKIRTAVREQAKNMIEERLDIVRKKNVKCKSHIFIGDISSEIIRCSVMDNVDLIVMGARGLGKFKQLLLGSVSNKIVVGSRCPVLIVK